MAERLRIAQVAPIADPVSPEAGSSIELLVSLLTEELSRRGHHVTLFATGDSEASVPVRAVYERGYHHDHRLWDNWEFHEVLHAAAAFERAAEFDVIHTHAYHYALPFTRLVTTPVVHTYHVNPGAGILADYARYPEVRLVAVSHYHRSKFASIAEVAVIHNGVDTGRFPFRASGGDYLLFLGHLIPKKGPLEAVHAARAAGVRLVMAGHGGSWYRDHVEPLVDGTSVEHVGIVDASERNALLAGAGALLFPSVHAEPFGLVLIEAMACGTPVAALDRCAVPEIVEPGVSGYYAPDVEGLARLIPATMALDRAAVRQEAVERFDHHRMVDDYEATYREALAR